MACQQVAAYWCKCEKCHYEWLSVVVPDRCASRKCRRKTWNGEQPEEPRPSRTMQRIKKEARPTQAPTDQPTDQPPASAPDPAASLGQQRNANRKGYNHQTYLSLSASDRLRYLREHPRA